ncbi:MAG: hypothetical protein K8J08_02280 [Thermoanaerobaculia bacterium]|nr:hypothetical protein [Thermoanaerobaculia bacterium]
MREQPDWGTARFLREGSCESLRQCRSVEDSQGLRIQLRRRGGTRARSDESGSDRGHEGRKLLPASWRPRVE